MDELPGKKYVDAMDLETLAYQIEADHGKAIAHRALLSEIQNINESHPAWHWLQEYQRLMRRARYLYEIKARKATNESDLRAAASCLMSLSRICYGVAAVAEGLLLLSKTSSVDPRIQCLATRSAGQAKLVMALLKQVDLMRLSSDSNYAGSWMIMMRLARAIGKSGSTCRLLAEVVAQINDEQKDLSAEQVALHLEQARIVETDALAIYRGLDFEQISTCFCGICHSVHPMQAQEWN